MKEENAHQQPQVVHDPEDWDAEKVTIVKQGINNLIWMHGSDEMTLKEADERAGAILNIMMQKPTRYGPGYQIVPNQK